MLNPEYFRDENQMDLLIDSYKRRNAPTSTIESLNKLLLSRKTITSDLEELQGQRNKLSKEIGIKVSQKASTEEVDALKTKVSKLSTALTEQKDKKNEIDEAYDELLLSLPNILQPDVPAGQDESDNQIVETLGSHPHFNFKPQTHFDLLEDNSDIDFKRGVKLAGSRFYVYNENLARLERELLSFMINKHIESGYLERTLPLLVNDNAMLGTGQFPKFKDEYYRLEKDELNLIPTAEVPLTNLYNDEILDQDLLPLSLTSATSCFRREAGSAGKDTRGLIRVHQFQKVELVKFCTPEQSDQELEKLTLNARSILDHFNLHYRIVLLCGGDTSSSSSKTYDLEVFMPGLDRWLEISSCSNFLDFQARRAKIRYKDKESKKNKYLHTINGSGVAAGRLIAALVEYNQTEDGKIDWHKIFSMLSE